jgi:AcrR family transcriptional regulator
MLRSDKRKRILKAAEALFAARRYHEATLDEITRIARIGKGTIYLYFKDKEDLFFHAATEGTDELCALIRGKAAGAAPFEERLLSVGGDISTFFLARRHLFRMVQQRAGRMRDAGGRMRRRILAKKAKLVAAITEFLETGVAEKRVRDDVAPVVLAHALLSLLAAINREFADPDKGKPSLDLVVDMFLRGAAPARRRTGKHRATDDGPGGTARRAGRGRRAGGRSAGAGKRVARAGRDPRASKPKPRQGRAVQ